MVMWLWACSPTDAPLPTLANVPTPLIPQDIPILRFWESQQGRLSSLEAADYWQFSAQAGDNISLRAIERGGATTLTLYNFLGDALSQGESIEYAITENGLYRVRVQLVTDGATEYEIGLGYTDRPNPLQPTPIEIVVGVPTPTPNFGDLGAFVSLLTPSATLSGALTSDQPRHVYLIEARANDWLTIEMGRISGTIDPLLRLYDPSGQLIALDDNGAGNRNARLANVRVASDGVYQVQVLGKDRFGEYALSLKTGFQQLPSDSVVLPTATPENPFATPTLGALPDGVRLQDHAPALGDISTAGGFQRFSFFADASEVVSIGVSPLADGGLRPMFEVYSPEGLLFASARASTSDAAGNALVTGSVIPETGAYIVLVMSENQTTGAFYVAYGRGVTFLERVLGDAPSNQRVDGTLTEKGARDAWLVRLQAQDVINVAVSSSAIDPVIEIASLDGTLLYRDDNSGGGTSALIRSAEMGAGGRYFLRVVSARGDQVGDYTLIWRYINLAPTPTTPPSTQTLLSVEDTVYLTEYNFYPFYGDRGQVVNVQAIAKPNTGLDAVLAILDPEGNVIAEGDDSPNSLNPDVTLTLPASGTYVIRVNGYLSGGAFDLIAKTLLP